LTDANPGVRWIKIALTALLKTCKQSVKIPEIHHRSISGLPNKPNITKNITDRLPKIGMMIAIALFTAAKAPSFAPVDGQWGLAGVSAALLVDVPDFWDGGDQLRFQCQGIKSSLRG
jgi:hypothetical protein